MNNLQIFNNEQFGQVRIATNENNEPLFCLADVCKVVGLQNPTSVKERLDKDDVQLIDLHALNYTEGSIIGNSIANFINESGFYDVLLQSSSVGVKPFRKWVTNEVLPTIRKHGAYMTEQTIEKALSSPDFLIQLATNLKEEKQKRIEAENIVTTNAPKVLFAEAVQGANSSCLIGELAKLIAQNGYPIGEKRLFAWMRDKNYLGRHGERYNVPNQQYIEQGLFEIKKGVRSGSGGVMHTTITTKITGKGQVYFVNKFLN
ncbi:MAG: phage antirepressor KilAC domain-containing protein [Bacteroides sp.]